MDGSELWAAREREGGQARLWGTLGSYSRLSTRWRVRTAYTQIQRPLQSATCKLGLLFCLTVTPPVFPSSLPGLERSLILPVILGAEQ